MHVKKIEMEFSCDIEILFNYKLILGSFIFCGKKKKKKKNKRVGLGWLTWSTIH